MRLIIQPIYPIKVFVFFDDIEFEGLNDLPRRESFGKYLSYLI